MTLFTYRFVLATAIFGGLPFGAAQAQSPYTAAPIPAQFDVPAVRAARDACLTDINRLCPDVIPGGGRIIRCLAARQDQVSPVCKTAVQTARAALGF